MRYLRSWNLRAGLWLRVALAISVGFVLLFVSFAFLGERALQEAVDRRLEERLIVAQFAASQLDSYLGQAVFTLEQAGEHVTPEPGTSIGAALADGREADAVLTNFSSGLVLLDARGRALASLPPELYPAGSDLSGLPHMAQAMELGEITLSDVFQHPIDGHPVVAITVPLFAEERVQGLFSGLLDLTADAIMNPLRQASAVDESEHAVLVDGQGRVLVSTFSLPFLSPGEHHTFYREAMLGGEQVVATVPFELDLPGEPEGHLHVMAFIPMQHAPWGLAVGGDEADILAGIASLRRGLIVIGIAALIAVWASTLVGTRLLVRPVKQLTEAADEIAAGNLNVPLQAPEGGEIGVLAAALDGMRNQLLHDIEELAAWNETLEERVAEQTRDLRKQQRLARDLLREVVDAQEHERGRLARELHDEIGQSLTAIELSLGHLAHVLPADSAEIHRRLETSRALIEQTTADLRAISTALRPGVLDQLGLVPALELIGNNTLRPKGISISIDSSGLKQRLPEEIETTLFRIAQEAMNNVSRHSEASAQHVLLRSSPGEVTMTLSDNGKGLGDQNEDGGPGLGLAGMRERVALSGGELQIESLPENGTTIHVTVPIPEQDEGVGAMAGEPIRLAVVDDHAIMREGLVKLLEDERGLNIVGLGSTGRDAIELARDEALDVLLLDIVLDDMSGLEAARRIIADRPELKVIMLTMYEEEAFLQEASDVGASGYFLKGSNSDELIRAIRKVLKGETYWPAKLRRD